MKKHQRNSEKGFTLVELAIVLVIIGLIVGGVLAGQDLIKAATVRAATNQLTQYDTGALTFQNKYNALPGDMPNVAANNAFPAVTGFAAVTLVAAANDITGLGDGSGLISTVSAVAAAGNTQCPAAAAANGNGTCISGEGISFWYELLRAGLITDNVNGADPQSVVSVPTAVLPASKFGGASRIAVQSNNGQNYYVLANYGSAAVTAGGSTTAFRGSISPLNASQLDSKLDDGNPSTGKVLSVGNGAVAGVNGNAVYAAFPFATYTTAAVPQCASAVATYDVSATNGSKPLCMLSIRASF